MRIKKWVCVITALVLLCALCLPAFAAEPADSFGAYEHVFIIGVDGGGAAFSLTDTPNFDSIFGRFAYTHSAATEYETISAQNWGSILTGVDYTVHGFTNSSIGAAERDSQTGANTLFYYARQAFPNAVLTSFVDWQPINYGLIENDLDVQKYSYPNDDPGLTEAMEAYFAEGNAPLLTFVQLDNPDHAAHSCGGFSEQYYAAVRDADAQIGRIYNAISAAGLMEKGLFIVVADHGETAGGHGGHTPEESSAVLAAVGRTVNETQLENVRNRDVAAIALYALGIAPPEDMTAALPAALFGEARSPEDIPGEVPETEPSTEPTTEPATEPASEPGEEPTTAPHTNGSSSGESLLQRIVQWFRKLFDKIAGWFRR